MTTNPHKGNIKHMIECIKIDKGKSKLPQYIIRAYSFEPCGECEACIDEEPDQCFNLIDTTQEILITETQYYDLLIVMQKPKNI